MKKIVLPFLGEGISKATVVCWHCQVGDTITPEDDIAEVSTDKAVFNVPADQAGVVKCLSVRQGDEVSIGDTLVELE